VNCEEAVGTFLGAIDLDWNENCSWKIQDIVDEIDPVTGNILSSSSVTGATGEGSASQDPVPPATQLLIQLRTGVRVGGREIRGRMFIPFWNEGVNTNQGRPDNAVVASVQGAMTALIDDGSTDLVVWSRKNGRWEDVVAVSVWDQWAVLRDRRS
jgi:hypothetical protein